MNKIIIFLGPSGAGKSTLEKKVYESNPGQFIRIISATTRSPRLGEQSGKDYYFLTKDDFLNTQMAEQDSIDDNFYGTPAVQLNTNKDLLLTMEPNGAKKLLEYLKINHPEKKHFIIYFNIPAQVRLNNMKTRGDIEEKILKRIKNDNIEERWTNSKLKADLEITDLASDLTAEVLNLIKD